MPVLEKSASGTGLTNGDSTAAQEEESVGVGLLQTQNKKGMTLSSNGDVRIIIEYTIILLFMIVKIARRVVIITSAIHTLFQVIYFLKCISEDILNIILCDVITRYIKNVFQSEAEM